MTSGAQATPQTTSGVQRQASTPNRAPAVAPRRTAVQPASPGVASTQFAQRAQGATAGVTRSAGRAVFASPAAKADKRAGDRAARSTPSARTASGDLWNGFKPEARSSVFAAEASADEQGGGAPMTLALLALGLGVVGLAGSAMVLGLRRRKAHAKATGRNTTE